MATEVAILGAGAWGTALGIVLARAGQPATLCVRRAEMLAAMRSERENRLYLPGVPIPSALGLTDDWAAAARRAAVVVMAVPSRFARAAVALVAGDLAPLTILVSAAKGIEDGSLMTMSAIAAQTAPAVRVSVLSGPGFAAEIARGRPAALVAAAREAGVALAVQRLFAGPALRIYTSSDVIGVEMAGAAKNVIAIAAGIADGLELGSSARAAVITRGLAEMMRLAAALGGRRETIAGLAGVGDLALTCTGELSRNRALGMRLGRGEAVKIGAAPVAGEPVAEGAFSARALRELAWRHSIELPIIEGVCRCLYEGAAPQAIVQGLLSRELKAEF